MSETTGGKLALPATKMLTNNVVYIVTWPGGSGPHL